MQSGARLTLEDASLTANHGVGIHVTDATAVLRRVAVSHAAHGLVASDSAVEAEAFAMRSAAGAGVFVAGGGTRLHTAVLNENRVGLVHPPGADLHHAHLLVHDNAEHDQLLCDTACADDWPPPDVSPLFD